MEWDLSPGKNRSVNMIQRLLRNRYSGGVSGSDLRMILPGWINPIPVRSGRNRDWTCDYKKFHTDALSVNSSIFSVMGEGTTFDVRIPLDYIA